MAIKYIKVPGPISLVDPVSGEDLKQEPVMFETFVKNALIKFNPNFSDCFDSIKCGLDICKAIEVRKGSCVLLDEKEYKKLEQAVDDPRTFGGPGGSQKGYGYYLAAIIPQFFPFLDAIKSAMNEEPKEE